MRLTAFRCVIQTELFVFEQVAVVGQERNTVVHLQRTLTLKLEIADGVERIGIVALLLHLAAYLHRLPLRHLARYGHRLHRERIRLLYVQLVIAGGEETPHQPHEQDGCHTQKFHSQGLVVLVILDVHCHSLF